MIIVEVTKCGWLSEYITLYLLLPIGVIEGLLVGLDEAEPLDMRYQAEPGREWRVCWWVGARRSLWICVARQSLGTRDQAEPGREIEGLFEGWGEAEPLDMRYQAEPRNEGFAV